MQQAGQPGIIYSGWTGLRAGDLPEDILLIDGAPHEWLFPRMAAAMQNENGVDNAVHAVQQILGG